MKHKEEYWTDKEVESFGIDPKDGTICHRKGCTCKASVDDILRRKKKT